MKPGQIVMIKAVSAVPSRTPIGVFIDRKAALDWNVVLIRNYQVVYLDNELHKVKI